MRLWAAAHAIDDMYQGLVPASVPYFVLDRHYSYVAASGLALAATLGSSLPQPVIGLLVDKWRLGWMAAAGVSLAGVGAGLSGLAPAYPMVWLLLLASGLGVAMFHRGQVRPGRRGRERFGDEHLRRGRQCRVLPGPGAGHARARHPRPGATALFSRGGVPAPPPPARRGQGGAQVHSRRA